MRDFRIRCSSLGKIMGAPKGKGEVLTETAKTYIRELAAQDIFGVDFVVTSKEMEKGQQVEGDSLALFNRVFGRSAVKNTDHRTDDYLTGECDIAEPDEIIDIKSAWSVKTFPLSVDDVAATQRGLYDWQLHGYMRLWDKPRARIAYCLVDTPEDLIGYEPLTLHVVSHIPEHLRVTTWTVERDAAIEAQIVEKVKAARAYYAEVIAEFDRTHQPAGHGDIFAPPPEPGEPTPASIAGLITPPATPKVAEPQF